MMRPVSPKVGTSDFALAAGHDPPTHRFRVVHPRTDGAGGLFLISVRCSFQSSPSLRNLPIMFARTWPALSGSS
jgi:hypothetical protein